jgi:UDP-glucose 4-epimerase
VLSGIQIASPCIETLSFRVKNMSSPVQEDIYLVTGGAGFIGSSIVRALVARGIRARVLDNFFSGRPENLAMVADDIELIEGSILDADTLEQAMSGATVVLHQAAIPSVPRSMAQPLPSHDANATGTLRVLEAARRAGVRRLVYAASSSAYGDTPTLPKVETMSPQPLSPYAAAKLAGEHYCQVYARSLGLETVCLRYFNVFGPYQDPRSEYAAVIPKFITAALSGHAPVIFGDGTQSRDFCFIDNVVEANLKAAVADAERASGRVFNIALGEATELNEIVRLIGEHLNVPLKALHRDRRTGDVKHSLADIRAAREALGYAPEVRVPEGLRRTIDWYRRRRTSVAEVAQGLELR